MRRAIMIGAARMMWRLSGCFERAGNALFVRSLEVRLSRDKEKA
jgi:hypothetical protein